MSHQYPEGSGAQIFYSPAANVNLQIPEIQEKVVRCALKPVTVGRKEPVSDLIQGWIVILAPLVGNLDGAHN